jgi:hypothetical protein
LGTQPERGSLIKETTVKQPWVSITFTTPENELTTMERAPRERLIATMNGAMEQYMQESRLQDVIEIELYPCPADCTCEECEAEAA